MRTNGLKPKISLLGASFDTSNMGVSALAEASTKCIVNRWPDAKVIFLGHDQGEREHCLRLFDREVRVRTMPIRFCKNIFLPYHFWVLLLNALLLKLLPWKRFQNLLFTINPYAKDLLEADLVFDITGGDSFSDIYGFKRFFLGFLSKWLITMCDKKLILLPQTYGPFKRPITKIMTRYILQRAHVIYSRDRSALRYICDLLSNCNVDGRVRFAPDVAFVLDPQKPEKLDIGSLKNNRKKDSIVVGLNVSGLLFNGGYTRNNMFGLKVDYPELISHIIEFFLQNRRVLVLLVPHVFAPPGNVESDSQACEHFYKSLHDRYSDKIFLARGKYNQNEIKYVIGMCDFFIGSRMHSCIAAISQNIPTVGLAYSNKFRGVFETVGMEQFVIDMRNTAQHEILGSLEKAFDLRDTVTTQLKRRVPQVKKLASNLCGNM